jgi:toxin YoeB
MRNLRRGILWDPDAWQDYLDWRATEPENVEKINTFIRECLRTPFTGTGKPEPLKGPLQGYWSRRITREHRFVYRVDDVAVHILACKDHY